MLSGRESKIKVIYRKFTELRLGGYRFSSGAVELLNTNKFERYVSSVKII